LRNSILKQEVVRLDDSPSKFFEIYRKDGEAQGFLSNYMHKLNILWYGLVFI